MKREKHQHFPEIVFALLGLYFAFIAWTYRDAAYSPSKPLRNQPVLGQKQKAFPAITIRNGTPGPNSTVIKIQKTADGVSYICGNRMINSKTGLQKLLSGMKKGEEIFLNADTDIPSGKWQEIWQLCNTLQLKPVIFEEEKK